MALRTTHRQYTARMNRIRTAFLALTWLFCVTAQAQWQWIDKDGRKVFSDRAPPSDVPAKNILQQPGKAAGSASSLAAAEPVGPASAASAGGVAKVESAPDHAAPKLSAVDKDLADKKKQADAAVAASKAAEAEQAAKAKSDNCDRAKNSKALMESGVRVSQTNAKGEREILDDNGRQAELKRIQVVMEANCK